MSRYDITDINYDCRACFNYMEMGPAWNIALLERNNKNDELEIRGLYNACKKCQNVCSKKFMLQKVGRRLTQKEREDCEDLSNFVLMTREGLEDIIGEKAVERITEKLDKEFYEDIERERQGR